MYKFPLDGEATWLIVAPRWAELGDAWQLSLLGLCLAAPAGLIVWLSRYELRLVPRLHAVGLLTVRLFMLAVLWTVVCLRPHVATQAPGRVRVAVDLSSSMDAVEASGDTRKAMVARTLAASDSDLLRRLAERHEIEITGFDEQAAELSATRLMERLGPSKNASATRETDLNLPLTGIGATHERPHLGVLLFSDGRHTVGPAPLARAGELGKQRIPIYPVPVGAKDPPSDWMVLDVQAPSKVFKNTEIAVEIRAKATNLPAHEMTVEMQIDGKPAPPDHRRTIAHQGKDDVYSVRFDVRMEEAGAHALTVKAASKQKEITLANNTATRVIRVVDDKAKLLLVDGEARWEYHYLANALLRDPTIALDRVIYAQPRIDAIKADELDQAGLPKTKLPEVKDAVDPLGDYDCIILGDVSPEDLPRADRRRVEKYVGERGGTLILVAGKRHLPMEYVKADTAGDDPLVKLLPITAPVELRDDNGFGLAPSAEGKQRPFLQLDAANRGAVWPDLPKHYWGIVGKRAPAASVLMVPSLANRPLTGLGSPNTELGSPNMGLGSPNTGLGSPDTGIIVQQNYGLGRVLFIGLDSTWRWRFRVGDAYHHRFWGQLARWAAAEKLLPTGNRHVRFGAREPIHTEGQEIDLAVRLGETLPPLENPGQARVKLHRQKDEGGEEAIAVVPLQVDPRQRNLLEAKVRDLPPGTYRMELDIPQYREQIAEPSDEPDAAGKGRDLFRVLPREPRELLDLSTDWNLMQSLAERSGGTLYTPETVAEVIERLARRIEGSQYRDERKPWQDEPMVWWLLGLLLGLMISEWIWRKCLDLP